MYTQMVGQTSYRYSGTIVVPGFFAKRFISYPDKCCWVMAIGNTEGKTGAKNLSKKGSGDHPGDVCLDTGRQLLVIGDKNRQYYV